MIVASIVQVGHLSATGTAVLGLTLFILCVGAFFWFVSIGIRKLREVSSSLADFVNVGVALIGGNFFADLFTAADAPMISHLVVSTVAMVGLFLTFDRLSKSKTA